MMKLPPLPRPTKGRLKTRSGDYLKFKIADQVFITQTDYREKVICLQKVTIDDREELRVGYYTVGKRGNWVWGRNATLIPVRDFKKLMELATAKGWYK